MKEDLNLLLGTGKSGPEEINSRTYPVKLLDFRKREKSAHASKWKDRITYTGQHQPSQQNM